MNYSKKCKNKWRFGSKWLAVALALLSVVAYSCDDESDSADDILVPSGLRYASVTEVYEGKGMESAQPVIFSDSQPIFEIAGGVAEDNGVYIEDVFTIKDSTGVIKLANDNELVAGLYKLDIKVTNKAGEGNFASAFELRILPSSIEGLQYAPFKQTIVRGVEGQKTTKPVFKGTKPATFSLIEESNFVIDAATGEISLPVDSDLEAGNYKLSVKVSNIAGDTEFSEVVMVNLETKPYSLVYTPQQYLDVQQKQAKKSAAPTVKGTGPFTYALKDNYGEFTIDENTGVISLPENHALEINDYPLTVVVTNTHGSVEFENAVSFQIVEIKAVLPSDLQYSTTSYIVNEGFAFESTQPTVVGTTPITYALVDDKGAFAIDAATGVISLAKDNTLAVGDYTLSVKATNVKGEVTFADVITVTIQVATPEVVFEDGWDALSAVTGEKNLGNMKEVSLETDPVQASNNKWNYGWGNWGVKDANNESARGAIMIPKKSVNDDWLYAENIDLTNYINSQLDFAAYSKYGTDANNTLELVISENFAGNVETATWINLNFASVHNFAFSQARTIDLSAYDGKIVTIAFRHKSFLIPEDNGDPKNLSRTTYIQDFKVSGLRK
ncbi:hypothetical protein DF185_09540 [Marinifilum breve]|uniref:Cadherin domain-containing protein n=1 Tax=Marinifilum breve TaxID=2184082 RepID=A0A2V3ZZI9_9BACT|nr:surface glycan-binding family protein [Marinifilum breve]PXY01701.1 hypothetical protein DF185_09540 [Marinifilum breve]